jgi:hypothetical protein
MTRRHETDATLFAYSEGNLSEAAAARVAAVVADCPDCAERVREYRALKAAAGTVPAVSPERLKAAISEALAEPETSSASAGPRRFRLFGKERAMNSDAVTAPAARRSSLRQTALALSVAIVLGAAAGIWRTERKSASVADNWELYRQADLAYKSGRSDEAVADIQAALKGRLAYRTGEEEFGRLAVLRDLARKNASYALTLAAKREKRQALEVNDLTLSMGDQLLEAQALLPGLVSVALYQLAGDNRSKTMAAAGDDASARAEAEIYRRRRDAFRSQVKPEIDAFARNGARGGSQKERELVREIARVWGRN